MPSIHAQDWLEIFDCSPRGANIHNRQLVTRQNVLKTMQTAYYIAICDDGAHPHKQDKCVFANRDTEPFKNLARGGMINGYRRSCSLNCLKQWWTGDADRIYHLAWYHCPPSTANSDYTLGQMYEACGNFNGLHMNANKNGVDSCGWNYWTLDTFGQEPSIWVQTTSG